MIEFTDWAREIIGKAHSAARRLNPQAQIRLARAGSGVQAVLVEQPEPDDQRVAVGDVEIYVESGVEGLIDIEEPHDRIVLKPAGSPHNVRLPH
ncbi:MAG: hypothetical protein ABR548_07620 [Actinomycetota bacterium]|nr:hypothetical protein [Actinomycetota bacterium]